MAGSDSVLTLWLPGPEGELLRLRWEANHADDIKEALEMELQVKGMRRTNSLGGPTSQVQSFA